MHAGGHADLSLAWVAGSKLGKDSQARVCD